MFLVTERKGLEPGLRTAASTANLVPLFLSRPERQWPGGSRSLIWSLPLSTPLLPTAFATTGASSANRFVSIGSRDGNFLNIPQQSQVGDARMHAELCTRGATCLSVRPGMRKDPGSRGGGLFLPHCTPRLLPGGAASIGSLRLPG